MDIGFVDSQGARDIRGGVAIVIDVMRAYTVAAWAFHRGAREIVLMDGLEEAVSLAATMPGSLLMKGWGSGQSLRPSQLTASTP